MKIGIIGISSLTLDVAFRSAKAGYKVKIYNPRGNSLVREVTQKMESNVELCSLEQAAQMEMVLLFIAKDDLEQLIQRLPDLSGKLIILASSLLFDPLSLLSGTTNAPSNKDGSFPAAEAHVVKLFNPVDLRAKNNYGNAINNDELFFIADHRYSRELVVEFLKKINFLPIDLSGNLHPGNKRFNLKSIKNPTKIIPFKTNLN